MSPVLSPALTSIPVRFAVRRPWRSSILALPLVALCSVLFSVATVPGPRNSSNLVSPPPPPRTSVQHTPPSSFPSSRTPQSQCINSAFPLRSSHRTVQHRNRPSSALSLASLLPHMPSRSSSSTVSMPSLSSQHANAVTICGRTFPRWSVSGGRRAEARWFAAGGGGLGVLGCRGQRGQDWRCLLLVCVAAVVGGGCARERRGSARRSRTRTSSLCMMLYGSASFPRGCCCCGGHVYTTDSRLFAWHV